MKKNILSWGIFGILAISLVGCGGEEATNEDNGHVAVEDTTNVVDVDHIGPDLNPDVAYSVPTPNELFAVIEETNVKFDASILNATESAEKYTTKKSQALNFGVYSADLAFISSNKFSTDAIKYFAVIKKLGDALDISSAFNEAVFEKVEKSIEEDNTDSLEVLSNDTYFQAYSYLEENDRGSTLALIVLGGWVESLYIMTNLGEYEEGSVLVDRIGEQKLTLENMMGFMMKYQDDAEVMEVMEELADIEALFWNLTIEEGAEATTEKTEDMYVFTGGGKIVVSQEEFTQLKELVGTLRTEIVEGEI